jgi:hypothetical protein
MTRDAILNLSYLKGKKVISSCTNLWQLEGARNYVNNFFLAFGKLENYSPLVFSAPKEVTQLYDQLMSKLERKEKQLSDEI